MLHNKSNKATLSVLDLSDEDLDTYHTTLLETRLHEGPDLIEGSDCAFTKATDGRFSLGSKKVCYGYQLIAWKKFGRVALTAVPSNKTNAEDLVISHLCGVGPRCCTPTHIILEPKRINDERTHCHYCLKNAFAVGGHSYIKIALDLGICPHTPTCYDI